MIILGLDPGLGTTGWGVIRKEGNRLSHIDNGEIETDAKMPLASRLVMLDEKLRAVLDHFHPDYAAAEKEQVQAMLRILLPGLKLAGPDAADALAVAITHAHHIRV